MACHVQDKTINDVLELLVAEGFEGMADAMSIMLNEAMRLDRSRHLGAGPWERSEVRQGYANGYKPKQVKSRIGNLSLQVPQTRETDFYPASLERGIRSERALKLALAEMGVSTRKVAKITEELCGFEISSTQVSRATAMLDEQLIAWRERPLGSFPFVVLDARYEKVRHGVRVIDCAVLRRSQEEYSDCSSKKTAGSLGRLSKGGMVKEFERQVFTLQLPQARTY